MLMSVYFGATCTFCGTGNSSKTSSYASAADAYTAIAAYGRLPGGKGLPYPFTDGYLECCRLLGLGSPDA